LYICEKINSHMPIGTIATGFDYTQINKLIRQYEGMCSERCRECWACRFCSSCYFTGQHGDSLSKERLFEACSGVRNDLAEALEDYAEISIRAPERLPQLVHIQDSTVALALQLVAESTKHVRDEDISQA